MKLSRDEEMEAIATFYRCHSNHRRFQLLMGSAPSTWPADVKRLLDLAPQTGSGNPVKVRVTLEDWCADFYHLGCRALTAKRNESEAAYKISRRGEDLDEARRWLRRQAVFSLHFVRGLSVRATAKELDTAKSTILNWRRSIRIVAGLAFEAGQLADLARYFRGV